MEPIECVVFDAYGTLVHLRQRLLHKEIPSLLGISGKVWMPLVRDRLLVRPFSDTAELAEYIRLTTAPDRPASLASRCADVIRRELRSVELDEDAVPVLKFLRHKNLRLGLASNLASPYKEPLFQLGLDEHLDLLFFSCDEGVRKPEEGFYRRLCGALDLPPERVLFVGDSFRNDVVGPIAVGMRALRIGPMGAASAICHRIADLGWFSFADEAAPSRLLAANQQFELAGEPVTVKSLEPLAEDFQGRYNLVCCGRLEGSHSSRPQVFFKRFLAPESAYVEEFAHRLCASIGLPACSATVIEGDEPFLALSRAPGSRMEAPVCAQAYYDVGRHTVFAYVFSNADIRPRNAFVSSADGVAEVTLIDFEYCFLNLALDMSDIPDRFVPESVDRLEAADVERRLKRRVLTPKTMWRALRHYLDLAEDRQRAVERYRQGFLDCFDSVRSQQSFLLELIEERVYRQPYLIVGTSSYRRAMSRVDIEDIRARLASTPLEVLDSFCPTLAAGPPGSAP